MADFVLKYGEIDCASGYDPVPDDSLQARVFREATEVVTERLTEQPISAWMPIRWSLMGEDGCGGESSADPLTMYIGIPIGDAAGAHGGAVIFSGSLRDVVHDTLGSHVRTEGPLFDDEGRAIAQKIRDALKALVGELDRAIEEEPGAVTAARVREGYMAAPAA